MTINGPILSSQSVHSIAVAAVLITALVSCNGEKTVDPAETAAIAATCQAKGLVARHEVGGGFIRTYCQKLEDVK